MLTLVNSVDLTNHINPKTLKIDQSLSQPISSAKFTVTDKDAQFAIRGLQEVVILDENGLANQTINMLLNVNFDINAGDPTVVWYWPISSTLTPAPAVTYTANPYGTSTILIDVSPCTTVGSYTYTQQTLSATVSPGQVYTLSATVQRATVSHAQGTLAIQFVDGNGASLGSSTYLSTANGTSRLSVSMVAPSGATAAIVSFGANTLTTTATGQFTFSNLQFEPQSLTARGVTYPTPLCNHLQANCYVLPNGYTVRQSRLFSGFVSRTQRTYNLASNRKWSVESFSSIKLLDSTYISGLYPAGQTDGQIIAALLAQATYAIHPIANTQLVTGNHVVGNFVMPLMAWDNQSLLDALQDIVAITGATYYLDTLCDLHYFPWQYNATSFTLSDTPDNVSSFAYSELTVEEDASQPKNRVTITGGSYYPTWIDPFTGDGSTKQFTLTQLNPASVVSLTVAGVAKKVGINGQNTFAQGYDALLDASKNYILFNVAPASGAAIVATYTYKYPLRTRAWDLASIASSYGIAFSAKVDDSAIADLTTATQRGIGELEAFAYGRDIVHLATQKALLPGQVVPLTNTAEGYSNTPFLVQKVSLGSQGGGILTYQCDLGAYDPDLVELLKAMHQAAQPSTSPGTVIAQEDITYAETQTIGFSDSYTVTPKANATYKYGNTSSKYGYATYS